ncbi:MAG: prolipoprotein diacylglyceryl transferase [Anaerolineae bacterium]|nr:prolipoprotein diacylglyceryl transferase [Anaerolineae bacterium]MDW8099907.1 prolipoprotein diacylglyceryl transferase [Anaerolineae bacterium]
MVPVIQLGRLALPTRPLLWLLAFYAGLWLAEREATRRGLRGDLVWNAGFLGLAIGLASGRLAYVVQHWEAYQRDWRAIFSLEPGAIAPIASFAAGIAAGLIYLARARLLVVDMADAVAPGLALALALIHLGDFLSGDAYGIPTRMPWAISLWSERRHPVQLYEMSVMLITLAILWRRRGIARPSHLAWTMALGYGVARLLFEPFRAESWLWPGGYRGAQVLGLLIALIAIWALTRPSRTIANDLRIEDQVA